MQQQPLFFEDVNEAIKALVQYLGGPKKVGQMLRPELTIDGASTWLRDSMNPDRREKLSPEQLILLMKHGRSAGCHVLVSFFCAEAGYREPEQLEPEDEAAALMRQYIQATESMKAISARMERVPDMMRSVVKVTPVN